MSKKILIIRFSSIGDIVLTTPVIRCLKKQTGAEIHFVTKQVFAPVLQDNPYVDTLHTFREEVTEVFSQLKKENFDHVIDLHHNLRSLRLKQYLGVHSVAFNKLNLRKFAAVNLKMIGALPDVHIVQRYLDTVSFLGVKDDGEGLDFFLSEKDAVELPSFKYAALVAGGSYFTKKIPVKKMKEICDASKLRVILFGGKEDHAVAEELRKEVPEVLNYCGKYSLRESAYLIRHSEYVISSDTGLMHIAAAFKKKIFSLWGNTIPEFGMSPYKPDLSSEILEVKGLSCRPCSKLGYRSCPKKHFKCMMDIDVSRISE